MAVRAVGGDSVSAGLLRQLAKLVEAGEYEVVEYQSDHVYPERVWLVAGHAPRPYVQYTVRVTVRDEVQPPPGATT
jgi:hypothetical protein